MTHARGRRRPGALVALAFALALSACGTGGGGGAVQCIAPANPGGGWDLTCRTVSRVLGDLGLAPGNVQVVNMPGAGGGRAFVHVVTRRSTDPGVLVAASPSTTLNLALGGFGPLSESNVRWVAAVAAEYGVLAVRADAPWRDLGELLATWRSDPSAITASGGSAVAGQDHMKLMLLGDAAGIDPRQIRYIPFDGGGEAIGMVLGGFVDVFSGEASEVLAHVEAGTARLLTVMARRRLSGALASVPTTLEAGYPVEWVTWRGFYVPGAIADSSYEDWVRRLTALEASDEWRRLREASRLQPYFMAGPEFEAFVRAQVQSFRDIASRMGLRT